MDIDLRENIRGLGWRKGENWGEKGHARNGLIDYLRERIVREMNASSQVGPFFSELFGKQDAFSFSLPVRLGVGLSGPVPAAAPGLMVPGCRLCPAPLREREILEPQPSRPRSSDAHRECRRARR